MRNYSVFAFILGSGLALISFTTIVANEEIPFPEGYRKWVHIKSNVLEAEHPRALYRGFNHVYGNEKAVQGFESGLFPNGSIIVFDVIEATENNHYVSEGKRRHRDVMVRDSLKYATTAGWGFAQFEADDSPRMLTLDQKVACSACHAKQPDHVFSQFRK